MRDGGGGGVVGCSEEGGEMLGYERARASTHLFERLQLGHRLIFPAEHHTHITDAHHNTHGLIGTWYLRYWSGFGFVLVEY